MTDLFESWLIGLNIYNHIYIHLREPSFDDWPKSMQRAEYKQNHYILKFILLHSVTNTAQVFNYSLMTKKSMFSTNLWLFAVCISLRQYKQVVRDKLDWSRRCLSKISFSTIDNWNVNWSWLFMKHEDPHWHDRKYLNFVCCPKPIIYGYLIDEPLQTFVESAHHVGKFIPFHPKKGEVTHHTSLT